MNQSDKLRQSPYMEEEAQRLRDDRTFSVIRAGIVLLYVCALAYGVFK